MWVVILTLHRILTEFKPIIAVKFSNSTWKINTHSVSVNYYFHFSSLILHYSSYKAFLCLLLFPSYNDSSRQGLRNSKSSSEYSLWRKNIKIKTQGLGQWVWQMLRHSTRNEKRVHQLSSSPNKKNQVLRLKSICLLLYCHRCGGRSETQGLAAWSSQRWSFSSRNYQQKFKHQDTLWKLLLTLSCIFFLCYIQ